MLKAPFVVSKVKRIQPWWPWLSIDTTMVIWGSPMTSEPPILFPFSARIKSHQIPLYKPPYKTILNHIQPTYPMNIPWYPHFESPFFSSIPIGSIYIYAIYGNIYHQYTPNVSIYTIHGSYGIGCFPIALASCTRQRPSPWRRAMPRWNLAMRSASASNTATMWALRCRNGHGDRGGWPFLGRFQGISPWKFGINHGFNHGFQHFRGNFNGFMWLWI